MLLPAWVDISYCVILERAFCSLTRVRLGQVTLSSSLHRSCSCYLELARGFRRASTIASWRQNREGRNRSTRDSPRARHFCGAMMGLSSYAETSALVDFNTKNDFRISFRNIAWTRSYRYLLRVKSPICLKRSCHSVDPDLAENTTRTGWAIAEILFLGQLRSWTNEIWQVVSHSISHHPLAPQLFELQGYLQL